MTNIIKGNTFLSQVSKQRENTANIPEVHYHAISMDMTPSTDEIMTWDAMEDLIMIGYPTGICDEYNNKPIIRKGLHPKTCYTKRLQRHKLHD
ncbi:MAG: hypothetical protein RSE82_04040, partial [Anaerovoracaceae bacterium]